MCFSLESRADESGDAESARFHGLLVSIESNQETITRTMDRLAFRLKPFESLDPRIPSDQWQARWQGFLRVRVPGKYRFGATVLGRFVLRVNNREVLNVNSADASAPTTRFGEAAELTAGEISITAEFEKHIDRLAVLRVLQRQPDGFEESIFPSDFSHFARSDKESHASQETFRHGLELITTSRCVACHRGSKDIVDAFSLELPPASPIVNLVQSVQKHWLEKYLQNPQGAGLHSRMPRLFGGDEADVVDREAATEYLSSLSAEVELSQKDEIRDLPLALNSEDVTFGKLVFAKTGCIACHSVPGESASDEHRLYPVDHAAQRVLPQRFRNWLVGTTDAVGTGASHHPRLSLQHLDDKGIGELEQFLSPANSVSLEQVELNVEVVAESAVESRFLLLESNLEERTAFETKNSQQRMISLGRLVVLQRGCLNCHRSTASEIPPSSDAPTFDSIIQQVDGRRIDAGCLNADPVNGVPDFGFSDTERRLIRETLGTLSRTKRVSSAPFDRLERSLQRLGCIACHERGGRQSVFSQRIREFVSLGHDKTVRDISAPSLDGVGERLRPKWLRRVLLDHTRSRSWLDLSMPHYPAEEVEPLIDLLIRADGIDPDEPEESDSRRESKQLEGARLLVGRTGLNCVGCHDFGDHHGTGVRAPDLETATQRLRFAWFQRWLHNPQSIAPGTRMPNVFNAGMSVLPHVLDGRESTQVSAIWSYLKQRENRVLPLLPVAGGTIPMSAESNTPIPTAGPLLIHGFLPEHAGLRAAILGFPSGLHFAWDTEKCQLTRVWQGKFMHQAGWEGSGKGGVNVNAMNILGTVVWRNDDRASIDITTGPAPTFSVNPQTVRFDESWATRADSGFAWWLKTGSGEFRIEEHLKPISIHGWTAFERSILVDDQSARSSLWLRIAALSPNNKAVSALNPKDSSWQRVPGSTYDWLVGLQDGSKLARWSIQNGPGSKDVCVRVPITDEAKRTGMRLTYLRVKRGEMPPADWQQMLHGKGEAP